MKEFSSSAHIALVIRGLAGRSGGAERLYIDLANILSRRGYRVTCLYCDRSKAAPFYELDKNIELINLFGRPDTQVKLQEIVARTKILPKKWRDRADWLARNGQYTRQLRCYFELVKPDVAISFMPPANTPALIAAEGLSVKVIPTNHNVPEQDYCSPLRWDQNALDREYRLSKLDNAYAIHVIFQSFAQWFPKHLQSRIVAVPNYVAHEFSETQSEVDVAAKEKIILAVGRLAPVKNYGNLIDAWSKIADQFPDWEVHVYGIGPDEKRLENRLQKSQLTDRFKLFGHKSGLSEEYARASIFCHPAQYEGFGLSPAEALSHKTPVVSYADCEGVNQFVTDGYNGLAIERDEDGGNLAEALKTLMEDENLRHSLGQNGPESVARFSVEAYSDKWADIISKALESSHGK